MTTNDKPPAWATFTSDDMHAAGLETVAAEMERDAALRELEKVRDQLTAANHHADGLTADLRTLQQANTAYANENARLRSKLADAEAGPGERAKPNVAPNGCDRCSVEPGETHRYAGCPSNFPAHEADCACWDVRSESCALPKRAGVAR